MTELSSNSLLGTRVPGSDEVAEGLYVNVIALFSLLVDRSRKARNEVDKNLTEELGRLFLWGESFRNRKLDMILNSYPDLRLSVLRSLVTLGKVIIRGKIVEKSDQSGSSLNIEHGRIPRRCH